MRKILLSLACAVAMTASAQQQKMQIDRSATPIKVCEMATAKEKFDVKGPKKAAADNVYYRVPESSMWIPVNKPFYTYNSPRMVVAPWTDLFYENMSLDKTGAWEIVTASTTIDLSDDVDENGNLDYGYYTGGAGGYYAPQYTANEISYCPANLNSGNNMVIYVDDIALHTFVPVGVNGGKIYSGGSLDTSNLYGAGKINYQDGSTGTSLGVIYTTPKPQAPLYVESVYVWGMVPEADMEPLQEGTEITMLIYNLEDEDAEPIVMTCGLGDMEKIETLWSRVDTYGLTFSNKVLDEASGDMVNAPFVIDYPAEIHILGFDQEGVNLGMPGCDVAEEFLEEVPEGENTTDLNSAYFPVRNDETGLVRYHFYSNCVPMVAFMSMYEILEVQTEGQNVAGDVFENINGIKVSDDGQDCGNVVFSNIEGVRVYTALDWTDEETGEEMYWSDDMYDYDWIQNLTTNPVYYSDGETEVRGTCFVGAVCDPLPEDVKGRYAVIHLCGRGVVSEPIYILQGEITMEEAMQAQSISNAVAPSVKNDKMYNLAGQQVSKDYKGIVIKNGVKVIVK